jgi:hypothetical protein
MTTGEYLRYDERPKADVTATAPLPPEPKDGVDE